MAEGAGKATDGFEPARRPQVHRALVRRDHEVELHGEKPGFRRRPQRVLAEGARDPLIASLGCNDVSGVGHVIVGAGSGRISTAAKFQM